MTDKLPNILKFNSDFEVHQKNSTMCHISTLLLVFEKVVKHGLLCLIYYITNVLHLMLLCIKHVCDNVGLWTYHVLAKWTVYHHAHVLTLFQIINKCIVEDCALYPFEPAWDYNCTGVLNYILCVLYPGKDWHLCCGQK